MGGNVWQWVQDCYHFGYDEAPTDGSARITDCREQIGGELIWRVVRGGAWNTGPESLRWAVRSSNTQDYRWVAQGFRVGRTLTP